MFEEQQPSQVQGSGMAPAPGQNSFGPTPAGGGPAAQLQPADSQFGKPELSPMQPQQSVNTAQIHAMPEKFMSGVRSSVKSAGVAAPAGGKRLLIVVVVVALFLGALVAGAFFLLNSPYNPFTASPASVPQPQNQSEALANAHSDGNTNSGSTDNGNGNENVSGSSGQSDEEKKKRDAQRVSNIISIAKALDAYYQRYGAYPQFLSLIPSDMLPDVPKDPLHGGPYTYVAHSTRQSYDIVFDVEASAEFKGELLTAGPYKLSPDDFKDDGGTGSENENVNETPSDGSGSATSTPANLDSDGDGLTAAEEALFRTSPRSDDTDSDGFKDATEIKNFFSPLQSGAVKLDQAGFVRKYTNETQKYSFYHPTSWIVDAVEEGAVSQVLITTLTGEDFSISIEENLEEKTSWDWYVENVSGDHNSEQVDFVTVSGHETVRIPSGLAVYIAIGARVIAIEYHLNDAATVNYPNIFNFILERLTVEP